MEGIPLRKGMFVSSSVDQGKTDHVKYISFTFSVKDAGKKNRLIYYLTFSLNAKHTPGDIYLVKSKRYPVSLDKLTGDLRQIIDPEEDTLIIDIDSPISHTGI
jgi:hypothetical protein